jgi:hypothetical protein
MTAQPVYQILVEGHFDEASVAAFGGLDVTYKGKLMVITGTFDQAALHGLLERIMLLGLDVVEARRVSSSRRRESQ